CGSSTSSFREGPTDQRSGVQLQPGESRDSPMRNCASDVRCFASPRNDGSITYIVAPSTHDANSAPPKSKLSLLVGWPDAVFSISSKMRWPHCCTVSSPSRMVPQLTSMSSSMRRYIGVLVASLMDGAGLQPNTLPRPVVKQTRLAPPATCPVAATGS